jgi:hypothetical protein
MYVELIIDLSYTVKRSEFTTERLTAAKEDQGFFISINYVNVDM